MNIPLLFILLSFLSYSVVASSERTPVNYALQLIEQGYKRQAIDVLNAEVKKADSEYRAEAAFHIAMMLIDNPTITQNKEKAIKYLRFSKAAGYLYAGLMLEQIEQYDETISAIAANMTPPELTNEQEAHYKKQLLLSLKRQNNLADYNLLYFTENPSIDISTLLRLDQKYSQRLGSKIQFSYFLVMQEPTSTTPHIPPAGFKQTPIPPGGYQPDFGGQKAKSMNISHYPAIVLKTNSGTHIFDSLAKLEQALLNTF